MGRPQPLRRAHDERGLERGNLGRDRRFIPVVRRRSMKNPWMSLWLSAANSAAGSARAFWTAETRRQQQAMAKAMRPDAAAASATRKTARPKRRTKAR